MKAFFKLIVNFGDHPKYADFSTSDFGLMVLALAYANEHLTDGVVPFGVVRKFLSNERELNEPVEVSLKLNLTNISSIDKLIESGVWQIKNGAYYINGFLDHNQSRAEVLARLEAQKEQRSLAGLASVKSRNNSKKKSVEPVKTEFNETLTGPLSPRCPAVKLNFNSDPDPDPFLIPVGIRESAQARPPAPARSRGCRLPDGWKPKPETLESLKIEGHRAPLESLARFTDYWIAATGQNATKNDWDATFRNWVRRDKTSSNSNTYGSRVTVQEPAKNGEFRWEAGEAIE